MGARSPSSWSGCEFVATVKARGCPRRGGTSPPLRAKSSPSSGRRVGEDHALAGPPRARASAQGAVRYGDEDLMCRGVGPGERPFAWVPQDAPMMAGSLEDNVAMGLVDGERVAKCWRRLARASWPTKCGMGTRWGLRGDRSRGENESGSRSHARSPRASRCCCSMSLRQGSTRRPKRASSGPSSAPRGSRTIILVSHQEEPSPPRRSRGRLGGTPVRERVSARGNSTGAIARLTRLALLPQSWHPPSGTSQGRRQITISRFGGDPT